MKKKTTPFLICLFLLLISIVIFFSGILDRPIVISMTEGTILEQEQSIFRTADGVSHGEIEVSRVPVHLEKGEYTLEWEIESDGNNHLELYFMDGASLSPEQFHIPAGTSKGSEKFSAADTGRSFQIRFFFDEGSFLQIKRLCVVTPIVRDNSYRFLIAGLLLCFLILVFSTDTLSKNQKAILFLLFCSSLIVSFPALRSHRFMLGDDGRFHMVRLENLVSGLREGFFPARIGGFSFEGYGALTSVFYPDVFLYPFAYIRLSNASLVFTMRLLIVCINLISSFSMYCAAQKLYHSRELSCLAAILYVFSPYRLGNLYLRCALGESLAMMFLPLFFACVVDVLKNDHASVLPLAVVSACVFMTHFISTLMCALIVAAGCIFYFREVLKPRKLARLLTAVLLAAILCLFQILPILTYHFQQGIGAENMVLALSTQATKISNLFRSTWKQSVGTALMVSSLAAAYYQITKRAPDVLSRQVRFFTFSGWVCVFLSASTLLWRVTEKLGLSLLGYIQFPWRFLAFASVFLSFSGCWGIYIVFTKKKRAAVLICCLLAFASALPMILNNYTATWYIPIGSEVDPGYAFNEYTLPQTNSDMHLSRDVWIDGDASLENYIKEETHISALADAKSDASISFPLFAFNGYHVTLNDVPLTYSAGKDDRITVFLPSGTHGHLQISYKANPLWKYGDWISSIAWLATIAVLILQRKRKGAMILHG